ncbi:MAG: anaerobic carbon-monoxide dehydrogenase catalytic subunit [Methanomassiliicoccus sp.]|nr:anaerobic carbon-monoxide dehydrogenase catalytic subunit [Methanomassiliicoccus sp.]
MSDQYPEILSIECLRVPTKQLKPEEVDKKAEDRALDPSTQEVLKKTMREGTETVWDRLERQTPHCKFCSEGISCQRCAMGPCRIMGGDRVRGVCGNDANLIVARNLLDWVAMGSAAHSDHGRDVVEAMLKTSRDQAPHYAVADEAKLRRIAQEYGIDTSAPVKKIAESLALAMMDEFGMRKGELQMANRVPAGDLERWRATDIMPRGIDREVVEAMHRIHMGVGNDPYGLVMHGFRASLADGWGGSMMGTEISDVMFGTPEPKRSRVNLGVLKHDQVNIALHGHNPVLSEMMVKAAALPELVERARGVGAAGINLVGLCCTGNELLMRKGVPQAGNHLDQELTITTGALEAMVVDYQCIFPTLPNTAACYHTKVFTTSPKAHITGATFMEIRPENAFEQSRRMLEEAIDNFPNRMKEKVFIPDRPMEAMVGFSVEAIKNALGGSLGPLLDVIKAGKVRGCVGIVGCNNPHIRHDYAHVTLARELIKRDILCVETGCAAIASAKAGLLLPESIQYAGDGLKEVCGSLGIPPVLHMGSCVDNTRVLNLVAELAREAGVTIDRLPVAGAAPEWYSPKAVSIAEYFVGSGVSVVLGIMPRIGGSRVVTRLLTDTIEDSIKAKFWVEPEPKKAAALIYDHIEIKRKGLGL